MDSSAMMAAYNGLCLRQRKPPPRGFMSWDMTVLGVGLVVGALGAVVAGLPVVWERDGLREQRALVRETLATAHRATELAEPSLGLAVDCVGDRPPVVMPCQFGPDDFSACWRPEAP